jgi:hypothetical protein
VDHIQHLRPNRATRAELEAVARRLATSPLPWYICGGWAIDCFLGRETRTHSDLEIGVSRSDQPCLHHLVPERRLFKIVPGDEQGAILPWPEGEWLDLPIFQIVAFQADATPSWFEFFLNEGSERLWRSRRHEGLDVPLDRAAIPSPWGMPILAPEIQLLYKAKRHDDRDEHDFEVVLAHLDGDQRAWLHAALERYHPGDPWLEQL